MAKMLAVRKDGGLDCDHCTGKNLPSKSIRRVRRKIEKRQWRRDPEAA